MSTPKQRDLPTTLYRIHDKTGQLVYVGVTRWLSRRLNLHRNWGAFPWLEKSDVTTEVFPTWDEAVAAETALIREHIPPGNHCRVADNERLRRGLEPLGDRPEWRHRTDP